jgi:hypothetical protein
MNKKRQNFFAVDAYLARLRSSLMHDIVGIGSAPPVMLRSSAPFPLDSLSFDVHPTYRNPYP